MSRHTGSDLRHKLRADGLITGPWISISDPTVVEVMSLARSDFLLMDGEHSSIQAKALKSLLPGAENQGKAVIYRVPALGDGDLKFALDAGVSGVMVPMIETPEQALAAVRACYYAPLGNRGVGPWRASAYYTDLPAYLSSANDAITLILQLETRQGLDNLEAITRVEGFDVLYVGPADLAQSLGLAIGDFDALSPVLEEICAIASRNGKVLGIDAPSIEQIPYLRAMGFRLFTVGSDVEFMTSAGMRLGEQLAKIESGADQK